MITILPNWHPIFLHYTVALLSISTALFIFTTIFSKFSFINQILIVARWNLWIGAVITVITIAAGFQAYNSVTHDSTSHLAMTNHRNWAIVTSLAFLGLAFWQAKNYFQKKVSLIFILSISIATLLLLTTAYKGGELVYRYGLGVMSLPKAGAHNHNEHIDRHSHEQGHIHEH